MPKNILFSRGSGAGLFVLVLAAAGAGLFFYMQKEVVVYFPNVLLAPNSMDCTEVFPVKREVFSLRDTRIAALSELVAGPTEAESDAGFSTSINSGVVVNPLKVQDGVAYADFSEELGQGMAGSCRVVAIRSQIEKTLREFPEIRNVVISIEKETEGILEP